MKPTLKISIAIACAFGASAALTQTVQRGDVAVSGANAPQTAAPIQTAQAPTGGAASGASTGGTVAGAGLGTTLVVVGVAVAAIAVASDSGSTVTH